MLLATEPALPVLPDFAVDVDVVEDGVVCRFLDLVDGPVVGAVEEGFAVLARDRFSEFGFAGAGWSDENKRSSSSGSSLNGGRM